MRAFGRLVRVRYSGWAQKSRKARNEQASVVFFLTSALLDLRGDRRLVVI